MRLNRSRFGTQCQQLLKLCLYVYIYLILCTSPCVCVCVNHLRKQCLKHARIQRRAYVSQHRLDSVSTVLCNNVFLQRRAVSKGNPQISHIKVCLQALGSTSACGGRKKKKCLKPFLSLQFEEYLELLSPEPASVGSEGYKFERKDKCG